ncbi:MAG TPA: peptide ABC transporter substrate-binding protein [Myxococcaceae bacterium]|nr:peptide ABC transporter substrate-binding protein [Myxococcaceae bacterium]
MRVRSALAASILLLVAVAPADTAAAARARVGGTLRLALLPEVRADRAGETPEGAVVRGLLAAPLCRLDAAGRPQPLLADVRRGPEGVNVLPRPGARLTAGATLGSVELAQGWLRALERSPVARALLGPVRDAAGVLERATHAGATALSLPLLHPWPDLEASLCHPALTPVLGTGPGDGIGPYVPDGPERGRASTTFPEGRPYPDTLALATLSRRAAQRALESRAAQVLLGDGGDGAAPELFATYLVHRPATRPVVALLDGRLDRTALVRSFVGGPAAGMPGLLPPALGGPEVPGGVTSSSRGGGAAQLLYAQDRPGQRAVAQRLQILLRDAGVQLTVSARTAEALDRDWRAGQGDLALRSVLLPPLPAPALAVVLELAGDPELARRELAALGALSDGETRGARARERALQLAGVVPVVPLYVEGLRARLDPAGVDFRRDGFGLLVLDDAWWP